jgi:hypothetical protein
MDPFLFGEEVTLEVNLIEGEALVFKEFLRK